MDYTKQSSTVCCPECGNTNLTEPDYEGLIDCLDCGTWFDQTDRAIRSICRSFPFPPNNGPHNDPPEEEVA